MSYPSPPSGWSSPDGVWNTDWSLDPTAGDFSPRALVLGGSANAVTAYGPWIPVSRIEYDAYDVHVRYKVDSVAAGDIVTLKLAYYDPDRTTYVIATTLYDAEAPSTGWEVAGNLVLLGPWGNIGWARFELTKAATSFNIWIDQVRMERAAPFGKIALISPTWAYTSPYSTWKVVPQTTSYIHHPAEIILVQHNGGDGIRVYYPGVYSVEVSVDVYDINDGIPVLVRIAKDALGLGSTFDYSYGSRIYGSGAGQNWQLTASDALRCHPDDIIRVEIFSTQALTVEHAKLVVAKHIGVV